MRSDFLIPAQTLLAEVNKLIVIENRKQTSEAKRETIKALIIARTAFVVAEKKYRDLYTAKQAAELSGMLGLLETKMLEILHLIDQVRAAISYFTKDVKKEDSTPVLEQIFNARVLKEPEGTDSELDEGSDFSKNVLALFQDKDLFNAQVEEVIKKQEILEKQWHSFFDTLNNSNVLRRKEADKELKSISKELIKALYEIQNNNGMQNDDLGMIQAFKRVSEGPMQLYCGFEDSAKEMILGLAQKMACPIPAFESEEALDSSTNSVASVSTCSSSFFSRSSSCASSASAANDEESENDLDEIEEPVRKCARR
ncbi:MAG: hypothetical protein NTU49_01765 [Gammaproteobacteria bacterium]|nr:hypothetical protein [Gammaproteobacteria bacterium]